MKKVLFVINTLGCAGAEVALMALLKSLDPEEYDVSLFVLMNQGEMVNRIPENVHFLNKEYSDCPIHSEAGKKQLKKHVIKTSLKNGSGVRNIPYVLSNYIRMKKKGEIWTEKLLWKMMADGAPRVFENFDLAVAYIEGGAAYYVANYVNADRKVGFIHIDYAKAGYTRKLDRNCYLEFDKIFAVSDEVRAAFLKVYPEYAEKTDVFHNIIDQEGIREKAKEEGGFDDDFEGIRLLTVGRLTTQKAYEVAIDAMKLLKEKEVGPVRWYVIGEGELRGELQEQIDRNGLSGDFLLIGARENPYPYFAGADIYVHATRFEGKSIAIQEAQTLGCCILVSDCSGNREQIEDGVDGRMCELTPEGISEALSELIADPKKREEYRKKAGEKEIDSRKEVEKLIVLLEEKKEFFKKK